MLYTHWSFWHYFSQSKSWSRWTRSQSLSLSNSFCILAAGILGTNFTFQMVDYFGTNVMFQAVVYLGPNFMFQPLKYISTGGTLDKKHHWLVSFKILLENIQVDLKIHPFDVKFTGNKVFKFVRPSKTLSEAFVGFSTSSSILVKFNQVARNIFKLLWYSRTSSEASVALSTSRALVVLFDTFFIDFILTMIQ